MFPMLRWGFIFLSCPVELSEAQKTRLIKLAAQVYFCELGSLDFDWDTCRGELRAISDAVAIGSFYGQHFVADLHLPTGSTQVGFLVTEAQLKAAGGEVAEA